MNGFELAGRPMKVNNVTDRHEFSSGGPGIDETDERAGIDLGATGRLHLMYKLAEGKQLIIYNKCSNSSGDAFVSILMMFSCYHQGGKEC